MSATQKNEIRSARGSNVWPEEVPQFAAFAPPDRLWVPLSVKTGREAQHRPRGSAVRRGEAIVENVGESSHVPLAPVDGVLGDVRPVRLTSGKPASAVELVVASSQAAEVEKPRKRAGEGESLIAGLERIRRAGVWADRHASPDLIGQLNQVVARPIDTIICTALDSDASLRLNAAVAAQFASRVIAGLEFLGRMTTARTLYLAVESLAGPAWMRPLWEATRDSRIRVVDLANDYPQADPTIMVYSLVRRRLRPGNLPASRGAMVIDAAAALAVGDALEGDPMTTVPVAVHDHLRRRSHFVVVPVGTPVEQLLKPLGFDADVMMVRGGDLLRDIQLRPDSIIGGGELALHVTAAEAAVIPEPCIRCAWCIEACPTLVNPALVLDAAQRGDTRMAERAGIGACIECGVCAHVCPSRLPLLGAIREMKT